MIKLTNLTKRYGSFTAVNAINLEVPRGELFGFLGPNGAGKTTTLRMIAGILRPTGGTVEIGGIDICERSDRREVEARLHPRPAVHLREAHGRRVPALRRGTVRPGRPGRRAPRARAARAVRSRGVARRAGRELQPRHAAEADHLERVRASARGDRRRRADGRARSQGGAHSQGSLSRVHAIAGTRS